jgi:Domain of unknown function (DUF1772)
MSCRQLQGPASELRARASNLPTFATSSCRSDRLRDQLVLHQSATTVEGDKNCLRRLQPLQAGPDATWQFLTPNTRTPPPKPISITSRRTMAESAPIPVRIAKGLAIGLSIFGGGGGVAVSNGAIRVILESPVPIMLRQWSNIFAIGQRMFPPIAAIATASYCYIAYDAFSTDSPYVLYLTAACCSLGALPVTFGIVGPISRKLHKKIADMSSEDDSTAESGPETARVLVQKWGAMNLVRALLLATAGVLGLISTVR